MHCRARIWARIGHAAAGMRLAWPAAGGALTWRMCLGLAGWHTLHGAAPHKHARRTRNTQACMPMEMQRIVSLPSTLLPRIQRCAQPAVRRPAAATSSCIVPVRGGTHKHHSLRSQPALLHPMPSVVHQGMAVSPHIAHISSCREGQPRAACTATSPQLWEGLPLPEALPLHLLLLLLLLPRW